MMNAMRPFAGKAQFPKSVCNVLIDGLDKRLVAIFHRNYADHTILHDLNASSQRHRFPEILQAMQSLEEEVQSITTIARSSVSSSQAFPIHAPAFPTQASVPLSVTSQVAGTLQLRVCNRHWQHRPYCHQEDSLWPKGDSNYAQEHHHP